MLSHLLELIYFTVCNHSCLTHTELGIAVVAM